MGVKQRILNLNLLLIIMLEKHQTKFIYDTDWLKCSWMCLIIMLSFLFTLFLNDINCVFKKYIFRPFRPLL